MPSILTLNQKENFYENDAMTLEDKICRNSEGKLWVAFMPTNDNPVESSC